MVRFWHDVKRGQPNKAFFDVTHEIQAEII